ncbi:hypothetical protein [Nonomuraea endophytica]|uniref:Putative nucleic acid-binding Zn-ribbon protein n=1 Tax=Nonomuraea endophytica TaxID=714136 RepID=A0A7W8ABV1_9ACTN|nr:hypothetical protein [Nonomuraea endophytica]MBB5083263.1 putative nucleic acid-binding Zn-ribbon protein [Nonomuraea endophytica]
MTIKDELQQVDDDLAKLRQTALELREQIGDMGATDQVERSQLLEMADGQDRLIVELQGRRDDLARRLQQETS